MHRYTIREDDIHTVYAYELVGVCSYFSSQGDHIGLRAITITN